MEGEYVVKQAVTRKKKGNDQPAGIFLDVQLNSWKMVMLKKAGKHLNLVL